MSTTRAVELQERAWTLQAQGDLDQAFSAASEALRLLEISEGALSLDVANLLGDLADIERERQHFTGALLLAERADRILSALTGPLEEEALRVRLKTASLLGALQRVQGDYAQSERHLLRALACARELGDAMEIACAENELGVLHKYWGRFDEALALYAQALDAVSKARGARSLEAGGILHNIGGALHARGDFSGAEDPARRAWEISRHELGDEHIQTLLDAAAYAAVLEGLERYQESELICRHALQTFRATLGPEHYEVAAAWHNLGAVVERQGRVEEAEQSYREALRIKQQLFGDGIPDVALTLNNLGRLLVDRGRPDEALPLLEEARSTFHSCLPAEHPLLDTVIDNLRLAARVSRAS